MMYNRFFFKILAIVLFITLTWTDAFAKQWVIFCAASGNDTHAWAWLIKKNDKTGAVEYSECYGFGPVREQVRFTNAGVAFLDGRLYNNSGNHTYDNVCVIELASLRDWRNCLNLKSEWNSGKYNVLTRNCVDYLRALSRAITDVVQPPRYVIEPVGFIHKLQEANIARSNSGSHSFNESFLKPDSQTSVIKKDLPISRSSIVWKEWTILSEETRSALKLFKQADGPSPYDDVTEKIEGGCSVKLAAVDLDGDNITGYMVYSYNCYSYCGTGGARSKCTKIWVRKHWAY